MVACLYIILRTGWLIFSLDGLVSWDGHCQQSAASWIYFCKCRRLSPAHCRVTISGWMLAACRFVVSGFLCAGLAQTLRRWFHREDWTLIHHNLNKPVWEISGWHTVFAAPFEVELNKHKPMLCSSIYSIYKSRLASLSLTKNQPSPGPSPDHIPEREQMPGSPIPPQQERQGSRALKNFNNLVRLSLWSFCCGGLRC